MITWEYKTMEFETKGFIGGILDISTFNETLNNCGREGWELVSCFDTNQSKCKQKSYSCFQKAKQM